MSLEEKTENLRGYLRDSGSVVIAFSAGVDSTLLAFIASQELGDRALAVTATSPAFPERELREAQELAKTLGINHRIIRSNEMANPNYANNPTNRCYHCKTELYGLLRTLADTEDYGAVLDGTNVDDLGDYRPGKKAANEKEVRSPLAEFGFTKAEIREASQTLGLKTADKPAFACMASRFPYGIEITQEKLKAVELAEDGLKKMGFKQLRVRVHNEIARIELAPDDLPRAIEPENRERIATLIKECGFQYVTLDLQGYRTGSLNEGLIKRTNVEPTGFKTAEL